VASPYGRSPQRSLYTAPSDCLNYKLAVTSPQSERVRILLVEDSQDILFLMKMELEALGYAVSTARDGESGLEAAKRELPDLIVSDIKMPGMDGYELIARLRQIPELASTPCVALTGLDMDEDLDAGRVARYNAHMSKPVDATELSNLIQKLTGGRRSSKQ